MSPDHRIEILLDDERHRRLLAVAAERGTPVGAVVRDAIDRAQPTRDGNRRAAGQRLLDAADMPISEPGELRDELEAVRGRRA